MGSKKHQHMISPKTVQDALDAHGGKVFHEGESPSGEYERDMVRTALQEGVVEILRMHGYEPGDDDKPIQH